MIQIEFHGIWTLRANVPSDRIRAAVREGLRRPGVSIGSIKRARSHKGDASEWAYEDKPVWHYTDEIYEYVVDFLGLDRDSALGPDRETDRIKTVAKREFGRLRNNGTLRDWKRGSQLGIWRVVKSLPEPTTDTKTDVDDMRTHGDESTPSEKQMRDAFLVTIQNNTDRTYKFALARAILEYCQGQQYKKHPDYTIKYKYLAGKFLEYYWRQHYFKIKQDAHKREELRMFKIIGKLFDADGPESYDKLKEAQPDKIEAAKSYILKQVFGSARKRTSIVVHAFQEFKNIGTWCIFYEPSDKARELRLKPAAFSFFVDNYRMLLSVVLLEWTRKLERSNGMLPKLLSKLEATKTTRNDMTKYRDGLMKHFEECFYCEARLKAGFVDVDHFIPWSFVFEDKWWNLVLACSTCNRQKGNSIPKRKFLNLLIKRNHKYRSKIDELNKSLLDLKSLEGNWGESIKNRYETCLAYHSPIPRGICPRS